MVDNWNNFLDNNNMITDFTTKLAERLNEYKDASGLTYFGHYEVVTKVGPKYTKVLRVEVGHDGAKNHSAIVAFVNNNTGDIFKPASFNTPAKHARGNVHSDQNGMEAIDPMGFVHYLK